MTLHFAHHPPPHNESGWSTVFRTARRWGVNSELLLHRFHGFSVLKAFERRTRSVGIGFWRIQHGRNVIWVNAVLPSRLG
jgi:hypothetical protein